MFPWPWEVASVPTLFAWNYGNHIYLVLITTVHLTVFWLYHWGFKVFDFASTLLASKVIAALQSSCLTGETDSQPSEPTFLHINEFYCGLSVAGVALDEKNIWCFEEHILESNTAVGWNLWCLNSCIKCWLAHHQTGIGCAESWYILKHYLI
jgi:hypothetical protein